MSNDLPSYEIDYRMKKELSIQAEYNIRNGPYGDLLGKKLGEGHSRMVFEHTTNPDVVVKIETSYYIENAAKDMLVNLTEWMVWNTATEDLKKYLCPTEWMSQDCHCLIMKKVAVCSNDEDDEKYYDARMNVGDVLCDIHRANCGWIDDRLVLVDYAYLQDEKDEKIRTTRIEGITMSIRRLDILREKECWEMIANWKEEDNDT